MEHIAIDLGGRKSQICVRGSDGNIVEERSCSTALLGEYLAKRPQSRVIVETCSEAFHVADQALALGHEARVVPATLVRELGVGARRTKTDRRDAQKLSQVSCQIDLPSVHIPSTKSRERKRLCGARDRLVSARTLLINNVRGWLRTIGSPLKKVSSESFSRRLREASEEEGRAIPSEIERELVVIEVLSKQIAEADKDVKCEAKADPVSHRLMTVPGVGPVTSVRFLAAIDNVSRFPSAHAVESYLGLVPGENSSSERQQRTSITKAGSPALRAVLVQCAWVAWRTAPSHPMVIWAKEVAKRRGVRVAIVALARKLVGILYAIWRDGTTYEAKRSSSVVIPEEPSEEEIIALFSTRSKAKHVENQA